MYYITHQWILSSEWVPSVWESKHLIKNHNDPKGNRHTLLVKSAWSEHIFFLIQTKPLFFLLEKATFWCKTICFCRKRWFEVKNILLMDLFIILIICGLPVDYCDVFISCLNSHSDGTHSLQRWVSDVMLNSSKSVLMKKKNTLHLGWHEGE